MPKVRAKRVRSTTRKRNLAVLACVGLGIAGIAFAASRAPADDHSHQPPPDDSGDTQVTGPGPGVAAMVYYEPISGEIHALILYHLSNPIPPTPQGDDRYLDVTHDPNYPALFDEFQRRVTPLSWSVDLETLTLKHR